MEQTFIDDNYIFLDGTILGYTGQEPQMTVPLSIGGYPVNTLGKGCLYGSDTVHDICVPEGIKNLNKDSIHTNSQLHTISLPAGLENYSDAICLNN